MSASSSSPRDPRPVPQMHQRSYRHDYHGRGIYLVTLCTEGRRPILGRLEQDDYGRALIKPSPLGLEVLRCWNQIPELQRELAAKKTAKTGQPCQRDIKLIEHQLMPDHFHGIIIVRQEMDIALGDIIRGFMVGCTKAFNALMPQICGTPNPNTQTTTPRSSQQANQQPAMQAELSSTMQANQQPAMQAELFSTMQANQQPAMQAGVSLFMQAAPSSISQDSSVGCRAYSRDSSFPPAPLWEKGYHDRLLTHEGQLLNMINYVRDNPRRLLLRRQQPALFAVQRDVRFAHWTFSSIGQLRLLDATLTAVHVRRYFTPEQRRQYMNDCILAARRGDILISPFISDYEKLVRDEAFHEGLCCIQLCAEPFSDYHKPPGELITPCDEGHLLLLTLASGNPQERRITRDECSSLNALAESMARLSRQESPTSSLLTTKALKQ